MVAFGSRERQNVSGEEEIVSRSVVEPKARVRAARESERGEKNEGKDARLDGPVYRVAHEEHSLASEPVPVLLLLLQSWLWLAETCVGVVCGRLDGWFVLAEGGEELLEKAGVLSWVGERQGVGGRVAQRGR